MSMERFTPGPWYSLPWYKKAYRWLRYQPAYKAAAFWEYSRYLWRWHREYKYYPEDQYFAPDRTFPGGDTLCVTPGLMWELTVAQDARGLERYWTWINPRDRASN